MSSDADSNSKFQQFKKNELDSVSKTFCAAKWLNATLWLNLGKTASCHHPMAHNISVEEVKVSPEKLHNTERKILARKQMLKGERPNECDYCWRIEDQGEDLISDRVFKSEIYTQNDLDKIKSIENVESIEPKTLEISFSNACNFACFYCNPNVSSRWEAELKQFGPYHLINSGWPRLGYRSIQIDPKNNPFLEAFWKWWPNLRTNLNELRITGGEPLLAEETWKLLENLSQKELTNCRIAINSNLGVPKKTLDQLYDRIHSLANFHLYTSAECAGGLAEFIRDGMNWERWKSEVVRFGNHSNLKSLNIMATINALSIQGFAEFLCEYLILKKSCKVPLVLTVNVLRYPAFQNIWILPIQLRQSYAQKIDQFLATKNAQELNDLELESIYRLSASLKLEKPNFSEEFRRLDLNEYQNDLKNFVLQYGFRRKLKMENILQSDFLDWIKTVG